MAARCCHNLPRMAELAVQTSASHPQLTLCTPAYLCLSVCVCLQVPAVWLKTYPSSKPLGPWTRDLLLRIEQLARWVDTTYPTCYWLSGFTYPTGGTQALLQPSRHTHEGQQ